MQFGTIAHDTTLSCKRKNKDVFCLFQINYDLQIFIVDITFMHNALC